MGANHLRPLHIDIATFMTDSICNVYVIVDQRARRVKIGVSLNPAKRMCQFGLPDLALVRTYCWESVREAFRVETLIHDRFQDLRFKGTEWFDMKNALSDPGPAIDGSVAELIADGWAKEMVIPSVKPIRVIQESTLVFRAHDQSNHKMQH